MVDITRPVFDNIWADTGTKQSPGAAKINGGWIQELMPFEWENWIQNRQDLTLKYLLQKGIPQWDNTEQYYANKSFVQHNGVLYKALIDTIGTEPVAGTTWENVIATSNGGVVYVNHAADASVARPASALLVWWVGSVEPTNAVDGDIWNEVV